DWAVLGQGSSSSGQAHFYHRQGGTWSLAQDVSVAGSNHLGRSVSISGGTAIIGAPSHDLEFFTIPGLVSDAATAAYVYTVNGAGVWSLAQTLTNPTGADSSTFGSSVDIQGDRLVVGAPNLGAGHGYRG